MFVVIYESGIMNKPTAVIDGAAVCRDTVAELEAYLVNRYDLSSDNIEIRDDWKSVKAAQEEYEELNG